MHRGAQPENSFIHAMKLTRARLPARAVSPRAPVRARAVLAHTHLASKTGVNALSSGARERRTEIAMFDW